MYSTIDFETTGTNITLDEICEVAVVIFDENFEVQKEFHSYCKTHKPIPEDVTSIHGITNEMVEDKPYFEELIPNVLDLLKDTIICGQNVRDFDLPMFAEKCFFHDIPFDINEYKILDTLKIDMIVRPRNLSALYEHYTGTKLEDAHTAVADCKASMAVLKGQIETYNLDINSEDFNKSLGLNNKYVDPAKKLQYINGIVCWTMGKHKDEPVTKDRAYAEWAINSDFPKSTKFYIRQELNKVK